ncbi:hypothetical protein SALBM311S_08019 [Streptomyces alboniger]
MIYRDLATTPTPHTTTDAYTSGFTDPTSSPRGGALGKAWQGVRTQYP